MKSTIKWFSIAVVVGSVALASHSGHTASLQVSVQSPSWSLTVGTSPTSFTCGTQKIPVPAAQSCANAIAIAQAVFNSAKTCAGLCPKGTPVPGTATCIVKKFTRPDGTPGQDFQVSLPYTCEPAEQIDIQKPKCDEAAEMRNNQVVFPADATDIEKPVDVDEDRGPISALYPGSDTTTDGFYPLPCEPSIGGITPPPDEEPSKDDLAAEEYLHQFETTKGQKIAEQLKLSPMPAVAQFTSFPMGDCYLVTPGAPKRSVPCDSSVFLRSGQPFEGRDIIYVHGLATEQLKKWILNDTAAHKLWPQDASEFLNSNGYFRHYAENYWRDHIHEHLFDPDNPSNSNAGWQWTASDPAPRYNPKSNRYLLVAWSSNQTIEYAQHALLKQIQLAIATNKNVVTPPSYPSTHVRPFCSNGCIIISHSTGSLITSSAMALAKLGFFGPGGKQIPNYIRAHVSFEGAISGSRLASVGMAIGLPSSQVPHTLCVVFDNLLDMTDTCIGDTSFVAHSILRDLMPVVAQGVWGPILANSPVPTLTVAGGHPTGDFFGLTKIFLPGLDDGVLSMNSACGNPNLVYPHVLAPSGVIVTSNIKAFDMSKDAGLLLRAAKNFISHKDLTGGATPGARFLAGACTPYISPTGMVMPVASELGGTPWDTRRRYPNHFSFIQASLDHAYDGGTYPQNKWPSASGSPASTTRHYLQFLGPNTEESSAVTDKGIYKQFADGTYLVHPSFANMHEIVRGRSITFKFLKKKRTIWIWKRTYHLLDKWEEKQSSHYVYEFVGRR